jgi:two-component system, sensor histidine kinase PdtaS
MKFIFPFTIFLFFSLNISAQRDSSSVIDLQKKYLSFNDQTETDSVLFYAEKALTLAQKINYKSGIAKALAAKGMIYMHRGDFPLALNDLFKALAAYEALHDQSGILIQLGNIGIVYDYQNDYQKALDYYFKALKIAEAVNDQKHISIQLCNIAIVYSSQKNLQKAEEYFSKALAIDKKRNDKEGISRNLANLGNVYSDMGLYQKSIDNHLKSLEIGKEIGDNYLIANCLVNIGTGYSSLKQYDKAENYFLQCLKTSEHIDDKDFKSQLEIIVSEFYEKIQKDKPALIHYKKHIALRDSIYNEENTKKSVKAEMNYEFDKKQAATKFENDKIIYKLEAENKLHKQLRLFLVIFIVLVLILLFLAKRAYDNKKQIAEFMGAESDRKEVLLQEVHHRINNNLQIISSLLTLQANNAEDERLQGYLKQSQNRIQSLSVLHELLYQNDSQLKINMKDYLNKVMDYHRDVLQTLPAKVDVVMNIADVNFPTKIAVPLALILNELVTNSMKYAFNDSETGKVNVSLSALQNEKNKWLLHVSDSGKGLPVETKMRKDSLGLRLVTIMTKQIKGALTKSSSPGATFEVQFSVPE